MIQFLRIVVVQAVVAAAASAGASAQDSLPSWMRPNPGVNMQDAGESQLMRPLVVSVPGMDRVRVRENIAYTQTDDSLVRMDVYEPLDVRPGERRPAVLFVHGGTGVRYRPKDWGGFQARGRLAAASGFVGIVFTHRLGFPDTRLRRGAQDVAAAIDFVHRNAATFGVDPERLCLVVYSAGGPLMTPYLVDAPPHIRCVVGVVPFMDMREIALHKQLETTETLNEFSPVLRISVSQRPVPLLIVRAGKDEIPDVNRSIDQFVPAALAANYPFAIVNHPDGGHGFETQHHSERTKEVITQTIEFLRYHLGLSARSQPPLSLSRPGRE